MLNALKLQIGSDAFSAQYQQAPAPPGGAMVKRAWIRRFSELPPLPERLFTLQSWDTATKGGPRGRHDDQCDSIRQALLDKNNSFMMWMTSEDWDRLYAGLSTLRPRNPIGWGRW